MIVEAINAFRQVEDERIGKNLGEGVAISLYRNDKTLLTCWPLVVDALGKVNTNTFINQSLANKDINDGTISLSAKREQRIWSVVQLVVTK